MSNDALGSASWEPRRGEGITTSSSSVAGVYEGEGLSLGALRTNAIRYWLAVVGLLSLTLVYVNPAVIGAIRASAQPAAIETLPQLDLPVATFPALAVPKLHPSARPAAMQTAAVPAATTRSTATAPTQAPAQQHQHATTTQRVPVVTEQILDGCDTARGDEEEGSAYEGSLRRRSGRRRGDRPRGVGDDARRGSDSRRQL